MLNYIGNISRATAGITRCRPLPHFESSVPTVFLAFRSSNKKWAIFENFPLVPPLLFCEKWPFSTLLRKMLFLF